MPANPNVEKGLKELASRDFVALKSIYDYRCLSEKQIFELNYKYSEKHKKEVSEEYFLRSKFSKFKSLGLIEEDYSYDRDLPSVYFLSTLGINILRKIFKFPSNIYDGKKISKRGYQTASDLRIEPKFIPHQYKLNSFVLELEHLMVENDFNFEYEDERHTTKYTIRPDGILYTEFADIFLEMDMGTETASQLMEKWDHYRAFKSSQEFFNKEKPILIYFICDNVKNLEKRIQFVKKGVSSHFIDQVDNNFNLVIGTCEDLVESFKNTFLNKKSFNADNLNLGMVLRDKFGMSIGKSTKYNTIMGDNYMYFSKGNNGIDFAIDDFYGEPTSYIRKISNFRQAAIKFKEITGREIRYIIRVRSINRVINDLEVYSGVINGDILFTTDKLIEASSNLWEACVTFLGPEFILGKFVDENLLKYQIISKNECLKSE